MISVEEAYKLINACKKDFGTEKISLLQSCNRTLATPVLADRDFPPYDRVMMDGIAVNSASFQAGKRRFFIEKITAAGAFLQTLYNVENCIEIMTGAVLPVQADAVIPYENCIIKEGRAEVNTNEIKAYQNVHQQGTDEKKGAVMLEKNKLITPAYISVMATVGVSEPEVYKLPSVAVCSTGDELIAVEETPLPHQIRQSNVYFLLADIQQQNGQASLYHLPDDKHNMKQQLHFILQDHDVVMLSGAVSKGRFDYLPEVLSELGMQTIFHTVKQRPGKPFLLGEINNKMVFGFPGNPLSAFVCYHIFYKYWLRQCIHHTTKKITAVLSSDVPVSASITHHILVAIQYENGCCFAEPIAVSNSGDIAALIQADGIISLPAEKNHYKKGEVFEVISCR